MVDEEDEETTEDEATGTKVMDVFRLGMVGCAVGQDGAEDFGAAEGREEGGRGAGG